MFRRIPLIHFSFFFLNSRFAVSWRVVNSIKNQIICVVFEYLGVYDSGRSIFQFILWTDCVIFMTEELCLKWTEQKPPQNVKQSHMKTQQQLFTSKADVSLVTFMKATFHAFARRLYVFMVVVFFLSCRFPFISTFFLCVPVHTAYHRTYFQIVCPMCLINLISHTHKQWVKHTQNNRWHYHSIWVSLLKWRWLGVDKQVIRKKLWRLFLYPNNA